MAPAQVGIITGGASGFGLETARQLSLRGGWKLHLLDLNEDRGQKAAESLSEATFHQSDVNNYQSLSKTFDEIFKTEGRLDFVFANAGIVERFNFYEHFPASGPPPEPDQLSIDIDLKSVVSTTLLALHYFRHSPHGGQGANLVYTASCGALSEVLVRLCLTLLT